MLLVPEGAAGGLEVLLAVLRLPPAIFTLLFIRVFVRILKMEICV